MKILFLTSRLPYPPIGGDKLKNYNLLKILSKHFDVHVVAIADQPVTDEITRFLEMHSSGYRIFEKSIHSFYINTLKAAINNLPLQVNYYYFQDVKEYVDQQVEKVDLVYSTLVRTAKYVQNIAKPKILDIADSVGLNYLKSAVKTSSPFWRHIYRFDGHRLLSFERECINQFDKTLFFNQNELQFFQNGCRTAWIPHGVGHSLLERKVGIDERYTNTVAFFGKMNVQHNIDAVIWFCKYVLHHLDPEIRFVIVGAFPKKSVIKLAKSYHNVEVTGYVDDPYQILKSSICIVAPMQTGAGIQNKILEAMALGSIVITTELAASAIVGARDGIEFMVRNEPKDIANSINRIHRYPHMYGVIKRKSREYIAKNFTWQIYESRILCIIEEIMK